MSVLNPVRKGDIVAVEFFHSYQSMIYINWMLATIASADRRGKAKTVAIADQVKVIAARDRVRPIGNPMYAEAARNIAKRSPFEVYANDEEVRSAILKEIEAIGATP